MRTRFLSTLRGDRSYIFLGIFGRHIEGGILLFCVQFCCKITVLGDLGLPQCLACILVTRRSFLVFSDSFEPWDREDRARQVSAHLDSGPTHASRWVGFSSKSADFLLILV